MIKLPEKKHVASFDVDPQNTFTPVCPDELPVTDGTAIVGELNAQATFAAIRVASRDAHSMSAIWLSDKDHPQYQQIEGYPDCDIRWAAHAIVGTRGFDFIDGLDPQKYDFQVYKGVQPDMHPYGACYHDLGSKLSTGIIEYLKVKEITTVIVGGLATDYCVKNTALQLKKAGFDVILNLGASRGISPDTTEQAIIEMKKEGITIIKSSNELEQ